MRKRLNKIVESNTPTLQIKQVRTHHTLLIKQVDYEGIKLASFAIQILHQFFWGNIIIFFFLGMLLLVNPHSFSNYKFWY